MKKEDYSVLLEKDFRVKFLEKAISKFGSQNALAKYLTSVSKERRIRRENIKDWLKGKHISGWDILMPIEVINEICKINSESTDEVISKVIKFNPPWKDPKNKRYLITKQLNPKITIKNNKYYLDLFSVLPFETLPSIKSGKKLPLFAEISDNKVKLWSEANWKKSAIKLERFVELSDLLFTGVAIYVSEGITKVGKYNDSISLGNSEPAIINLFFAWLNLFLIDYHHNAKIEFNGKNSNKGELSDFWISKVPFVANKPIIVRERHNLHSGLINNKGVLNIRLSNTVLKAFIINLIKCLQEIALTNKQYMLAYLNGLFASEGSVSRPKLKEVTIGCAKNNERKFIKSLLKKLSLRFTIGKNQFSIHGWNSFFLLYENNVFGIPQINNISKKAAFEEGFKNHQTTKGLRKLKKFADKKFRATDWQREFKLKKYISAHKFLRKFVDDGLLLTEFDKNTKIYYINPKKLNFLEKILSLK